MFQESLEGTSPADTWTLSPATGIELLTFRAAHLNSLLLGDKMVE